MHVFRTIASRLNDGAAVVAALLILYIVGHILVEILLRALFNTSTFVLDEFVGYAVAGATFMGLGPAFRANALIRVNLLTSRMNASDRRAFEIAGVGATLLISVFAAFWIGRDALRNFMRGSVSESIAEVPLWIPVGICWLGLSIFAIQLAVYLIDLCRGAELLGETAADRDSDDAVDATRQAEPGARGVAMEG